MRESSEKACILKQQMIGKCREQEKYANAEEQLLLEQAIEQSLKQDEKKAPNNINVSQKKSS